MEARAEAKVAEKAVGDGDVYEACEEPNTHGGGGIKAARDGTQVNLSSTYVILCPVCDVSGCRADSALRRSCVRLI